MTHPCADNLAKLPCNLTGVGFTCYAWNATDTKLILQPGQGVNFPTPAAGQRFWVDVEGCDCCTRLEVTARAGDELTVLPNPTSNCQCIKSNAKVTYAANSTEHMRMIALAVGVNAVPPLYFDCVTRRLWLDCEELKDMVNKPCVT